MFYRIPALLAAALLAANSAYAQDDMLEVMTGDDVDILLGGIGPGVSTAANTGDGTSSGIDAQVHFRLAELPAGEEPGYMDWGEGDHLIAVFEGDLNYNVIARNRGDGDGEIDTGVSGRIRFLVGGTPFDSAETACDIYAGVSGAFDGRASVKQADSVSISLGPETGILCKIGESLVMLSPSVRVGRTAMSKFYVAEEEYGDRDYEASPNVAKFGGALRLWVAEKVILSAAVTHNPRLRSVGEWTDDTYDVTEADVSLSAEVSERWRLHGYARGAHYEPDTGGGSDFSQFEAGVNAIRAF